ncbi:MAG: BREX system ATP-binding domain-containing protein [Planctomycetota bacterium]
MQALEPGRVIAHLRIEKEIGRGAFGTVHLARDELIGRRVAVKHLRPPSALSPVREMRERVLREARAVGKLNSPNIAMLHQLHELEDEGWLLEMEYVAGGTLSDLLRRDAPLLPQRVAELASGILRGLGAAHDAGLVHGDMKPGNVLLAEDGSPKLVDFGLSWMVDDVSMSRSGSGGPVGTPAYMSPEVIMGARGTVASDLWSTGVMLSRMLADELPFPSNTLHELFLAVQNQEPRPLPDNVPVWLQALIARLLQKRPEDRPGSCTEALEALDASTTAERIVVPAPKRVDAERRREQLLVGRDEERATFNAALDRLDEGIGGAVLLSGEAGMGKSALLRVVAHDAAERGFSYVKVSVTALEGMVRPLVETMLAAIDREADGVALGTTAPVTALRTLLQEQAHGAITSRQQVVWAIEQVIEMLTERRPVVLAVDNTQYGQPEDWQLLCELVKRLPRRRVFLVVGFRTHDIEASASTHSIGGYHELASVRGVRQIALGPLTQEAMLELLRKRADVEQVDSEVAAWLIGQAEGNPFFAAQMLSHLVEHGGVEHDNKTLVAGPKWRKVAIPHRFQELVNLRLAGLSDEQRELLDTAAIDGRVFDAQALQAILERPLLGILRALQSLYRERNLVEPAGDAFRFTSGLVQEVIVQSIAPALRKAIHESLAQHLESRDDDARVSPERLAVHWHEGGDPKRAAPYFLKAAAGAAARQEYRRSVDLFERSEIGRDVEDVRVHAEEVHAVARSFYALGRHDDGDQLLERLRESARLAGDEILELRCLVRYSRNLYFRKGAAAIDSKGLERATAVLPPGRGRANAWYVLGLLAKYKADLDRARDCFLKARDGYANRNEYSSVIDQLASLHLRSGEFDDAERMYGEAARMQAELGRRTNALVSTVNRAIASLELGRLDDLPAQIRQCVDGFQLEGNLHSAAMASVVLGKAHYAIGETELAKERLRSAYAIACELEHLTARSMSALELGHIEGIGGDLSRSEALLRIASKTAQEQDDSENVLRASAHEIQLACFFGRTDAARRVAAEVSRLMEHVGHAWISYAALILGESTLYGLPAETVQELSVDSETSTVLKGLQAFGQIDASADDLLRAAEALRGSLPGPRRAAWKIIGDLLWSEAMLRRGVVTEASSEARAALDGSRALGHVWLQLCSLRQLDKIEEAPHESERSDLLATITRDLPDEDSERVRAVWGDAKTGPEDGT